MSWCPYSHARCKGVDPNLFLTFTDAPLSNNVSTIENFPKRVALEIYLENVDKSIRLNKHNYNTRHIR